MKQLETYCGYFILEWTHVFMHCGAKFESVQNAKRSRAELVGINPDIYIYIYASQPAGKGQCVPLSGAWLWESPRALAIRCRPSARARFHAYPKDPTKVTVGMGHFTLSWNAAHTPRSTPSVRRHHIFGWHTRYPAKTFQSLRTDRVSVVTIGRFIVKHNINNLMSLIR